MFKSENDGRMFVEDLFQAAAIKMMPIFKMYAASCVEEKRHFSL